LLGSCDPPGSWPDHKSVFILKGGQSRRSVPGAPLALFTTLIVSTVEGRERKIKRKGKKKCGKAAAKQRPTSGESAAEKISCRSGAHLVFAFRSFLMKADFGEAGLISLIPRRQQQSQTAAPMQSVLKNGLQASPYRSVYQDSKWHP
jgi:hypothetical protein